MSQFQQGWAPPTQPQQQFAAPMQQPQQFAPPAQFAAPMQQPQQFAPQPQQPQQQFAPQAQPQQQWGSPNQGAFGAPVGMPPAVGAPFPAAGRPGPGFGGPQQPRAAFDPNSLAGFDAASSRRNAAYLKPCHGIFKILQVELGKSNGAGDFFVINLVCLHEFNPDKYRGPVDKDPGYGHQVGEQCTIWHGAKFRSFHGNIKADLKAILGMDDSQITTQVLQWAAGPENPLRDVVIEVAANVIITKGNKEPFTAPTIRGRVPYATVKAFLLQTDPSRIERFFPNGELDRLIAMEQQGSPR